jgi:protocatechuate 3,4-dioxygenase beta subunit
MGNGPAHRDRSTPVVGQPDSDEPAKTGTGAGARRRGARGGRWLAAAAGAVALALVGGLLGGRELAREAPVDAPEARGPAGATLAAAPVVVARITLPDGMPAAGARVRIELERDASVAAEAVTNGEGRFALGTLPEGRYVVRAELEGFAAAMAVHRFPADAPPDVALRPASTVSGQVLGLDGLPAAGVEVRIVGSGLYPALTGTTDAAGRFVLGGIPPGVYEVHARLVTDAGELAAPPRRGLTIEPGARAVLSFALSGGAVLSGVVVDEESGAPIAGARVRVGTETLAALPRVVTTGADGSFRLAGLEDRVHRLTIEDDVHAPEIGLEAAPGSALRVTLARAASLGGVVLDEAHRPIAGAAIEVLGSMGGRRGLPITIGASASIAASAGVPGRLEVTDFVPPIPLVPGESVAVTPGHGGRGARIVTASDGSFHIEHVPPGVVQVVARAPGFGGAASEALRLHPGESREGLEVVLAAAGVLRGSVVDEDDAPVAGLLVEVRSDADPLTRIAVTGEDGGFELGDVVGALRVRASPHDRPPTELRAEVPSGGARNVTLRLDPAGLAIAGAVVDRRGRPIEGAQVRVVPLRVEGGATRTVFTDAWGRFSAERVARPPLRIVVEHAEHAAHGGVEVETLDPLSVTLGAALRAAGRVRDPWTGAGVEGARVTLVSEAVPPVVREVETDAEGAYQVLRLGAGRWHRRVVAEGRAPLEDGLVVRESRWGEVELDDVELPAAVALEGDVVDRLGRTVGGAEVRLDGEPETAVHTDARGHFVLPGIGPGEHTVTVRHDAGGDEHTLLVREGVEPSAWVAHLPGRADDEAAPRAARRGVPLELAEGEVVWADGSLRALGVLPGDHVRSVDGGEVSEARLGGTGPALLVLERSGGAFTVVAPRRLWSR